MSESKRNQTKECSIPMKDKNNVLTGEIYVEYKFSWFIEEFICVNQIYVRRNRIKIELAEIIL